MKKYCWIIVLGFFATSVWAGIDAKSGKVINVATPTDACDAANKQYVDDAAAAEGHNILSIAHGDAEPNTVSRGSLIVGTADPNWGERVLGASGYILRSNGSDALWAATTNITQLGTIITGTWNATAVDINSYTNLVGGTGITLTNDTLSTTDSEIVHDNLSGFEPNEHIDWTGASAGTIDATNIEDKFLRNDGDDVTSGSITTGGSTGVRILGASGALTLAGVGGSNNESLGFDFESIASQIAVSSPSGADVLLFNAISAAFADNWYTLYGSDSDWGIRFASRGSQLQIVRDPLGVADLVTYFDLSGNINLSDANVTTSGITQSGSYKSGDGSTGITQSETGVTDFDIVIKDGLITSFTKN